MEDFFSLLLGTIRLRPYVFMFLLLFLLLARGQIGWKRTLLWTVSGYVLAFLAEYSSIHWGFPFGGYYYIETTRNRELWVAGVPFMDSLSFTFLTYVGFSCAWNLCAAFKGSRGEQGYPGYWETRRSWQVLVIGAAVTTLMDVVIDPVALMGDRWFLGQIYGYRHPGWYFGIPVSNFLGWFFLSAVVIGVNQRLDALMIKANAAKPQPSARRPVGPLAGSPPPEHTLTNCARNVDVAAEGSSEKMDVPYLPLGGFVLFVCVTAFNLGVTLWLKAYALFFVGLSLVVAFLSFSLVVLSRSGLARPLMEWRPAGPRSRGVGKVQPEE